MPELVLDYEASKFWLDLLKISGTAVACLVTWYMTFYRRRKADKEATDKLIADNKDAAEKELARVKDALSEKIDDVKTDLGDTQSAVAALEKEVAGMPGHKEVGELYTEVNKVNGNLREVMGKLSGLATNIETMQTYLLHNGESK